ncbi:MAG: 39S ribosomal protein L45 [Desulfovibrio sp.]|nr:39S ribosomal protein L45 [Desulfovibrio sp.]
MKNWIVFSLLFLSLATFSLALPTDSEAARMGGGRSFGSQPTMRAPTSAPRPAQAPRQQPFNAPQTSRPMPQSGGMGAMGGLFGGLLAGTMLGSLLGGGAGAGAAGAGGGLGLIDILLFGLIIWFGLKFFRRMRSNQSAPQSQPGYGQSSYQDTGYSQHNDSMYRQGGGSAWDSLRNTVGGSSPDGFGTPNIPADFNVDEFLQGAKAAYVRMQSSWDQRDLNDISQFATESVMSVLREQMREDPNPSRTELININVQLVDVRDEGVYQRAQVFFDVLLREDPTQGHPEPAREIWHFMRQIPDGTWKLDGIQQVN